MGRLVRVKVYSSTRRVRKNVQWRPKELPVEPFRVSNNNLPSVCDRRMGGKYFKSKEQDEDERRAAEILKEWL